ncbi:hypothetical protein EDC04DRAFT_2600295 [Pisolithus marmoratus]|nr:hypothetical protein EDC04DRAFT_2600295 [Pisolithus marmoratus]
MALYYDKMAFYMEQALFMATDYGELPQIKSKLFAKIALPEVIPILLSLLTLQEEVVDEVDTVIPFIKAHIKSLNGHQWEAAVMAFGSILDGPYPSILTYNPRIVTKCCWALMSLADQPEFLEEESVPSQISHLSPYFDDIINALLRVMDICPEHVDNYFDADAATSRSAVCCQSITWQLGEGIQPMADHIMTLVLQLVWAAGKTSTVLEDTLLAVGSLASGFLQFSLVQFRLNMLSPNSKLLPQPSTDSLTQVLPFTTMPATPAILLDITQHPTCDGERCQVPFIVMMGIIGHGGTLLLPLQMSQTWLAFEDDRAHSCSVSVMLVHFLVVSVVVHECGGIACHAFISNCQGTTLMCNSNASATPIQVQL